MWIKIEFKVQQNAMKKQVKHFNGSQHLEQKKVYGPWQYISMGDLNEEWKDQNEKQLIERLVVLDEILITDWSIMMYQKTQYSCKVIKTWKT